MLTVLLALEALLKKPEELCFQRRGIVDQSVGRSQENPGSSKSHLNLSASTTSQLHSESSINGAIMSLGSQSPAAVSAVTQKTENVAKSPIDDTVVIAFNADDKLCCHETNSKNVRVVASPGVHDHGSSKVKLKNFVDYKWEVKNYPGHLIAVHIDEKYIAYVINVNNKVSRMEGMVRVCNTSKGLRALIKGLNGEVLDLQFAHIEKEHILASIDASSLYVHKIDTFDGALLCNLIIKIEDPLSNYCPKYDKISWCPFIDAPGEHDEDSQLVVWARGSTFQCFNINIIVAEHGLGKFLAKELKSGYLRRHDDSVTITWVALSPDGSTLGVGSTDGAIRFYQIYIHDKDPRCLHEWNPHNGKPVSSFFFLDNLTQKNSDPYWKFAITGAENNTEFKVWDCGTWNCLQTINIASSNNKTLHLIAELDRTASYLVLSSLETRICYVMQIVNTNSTSSTPNGTSNDDGHSNANANEASGSCKSSQVANSGRKSEDALASPTSGALVFVKSISEFPLSSGILSFSIVDAAFRRYKCANDTYMCEELDDYDDDSSIFCVVVHMFIVQSKSMQECHILYQPSVQESQSEEKTAFPSQNYARSLGSTSNDSSTSDICKKAHLADGPEEEVNQEVKKSDAVKSVESASPLTITDSTSSEKNALQLLLGITHSGVGSNHSNLPANAAGSNLVAVAAAAAAAPSVIVAEKTESRNSSPIVTANAGARSYAQVNLMTPDAFTASTSNAGERKTPENVSSEVLNTILMLAAVAGQNTSIPSKAENVNLLNLVNNKLIEDKEQQKLQMKRNAESQKNFMAIDRDPGRTIVENLTSGGSSPSREVQEIMSLQDYEKTSFSGEDILEVHNDNSGETDAVNTDNVTVQDAESDGANENPIKGQVQTTNWPKLPDVPKLANSKHSAELQNAANLISSVSNLSSSHVAPTLGGRSNSNSRNTNVADGDDGPCAVDLNDINIKMTEMLDLIKMQSLQINNLQTEVKELKKANPMVTQKSLTELGFKLEIQLSKMMETYLMRYETEHNRKLSSFLMGKDAQNRELRDSIIQIMNQYVLTQFGEMVSKVLTVEIQRRLDPMITAKINNLQQQIQTDIGQKLKSIDLMVKENIAQACKNKGIIDAFGKSVLVGVQSSLQSAFIESMSSTLIPAYEKSSQNMFKQLHEAFSIGIKEFMEQFDSYLQQLQPMQEASEDILNRFSLLRQHLDDVLMRHRTNVQAALVDTRKDIKSLELLLSRQIQDTIRLEVRKSFETQAAVIRSQANTPAPMYDMKETIKHLLLQGQINTAFNQALLANDLSLVEYTLKSADHSTVFTPDCCLEQKVLLSLIQQISADMSDHNEVKQNYLAEALLAINPRDPITREHAPKVLQELFRNCQHFLINYPKSSQVSNVRMLMKAVQAYKEQF